MRTRTGNEIRELRIRAGWSQKELAERVNVSQVTVSCWETGKSTPRPQQRESLEAVLGTVETVESSIGSSSITTWVKQRRVSLGYSVPELATRAGLTPPAIYRIESGLTSNLRVKTRRKLEKVLGPVPAETAQEAATEAEVVGLGAFEDFDPYENDDRPTGAGIYVLYDISERPVYVGQGGNVRQRIRAHEDKFWFKRPIVESASWIAVAETSQREQIERILIKFLKSNAVLNKQNVNRR